jgi:hypothetical protein
VRIPFSSQRDFHEVVEERGPAPHVREAIRRGRVRVARFAGQSVPPQSRCDNQSDANRVSHNGPGEELTPIVEHADAASRQNLTSLGVEWVNLQLRTRGRLAKGVDTTQFFPGKTSCLETGGAQDGARIAESALGGSVSPPVSRLVLLAKIEGLAVTREAVMPIIRMFVTLNPADREALADALANLPIEDLTRLAIPRSVREEV